MVKQVNPGETAEKKHSNVSGNAGAGAVYGLGLIGAIVYFIQHADSFGEGAIGIIKAVFWPALLVYKALQLLNM